MIGDAYRHRWEIFFFSPFLVSLFCFSSLSLLDDLSCRGRGFWWLGLFSRCHCCIALVTQCYRLDGDFSADLSHWGHIFEDGFVVSWVNMFVLFVVWNFGRSIWSIGISMVVLICSGLTVWRMLILVCWWMLSSRVFYDSWLCFVSSAEASPISSLIVSSPRLLISLLLHCLGHRFLSEFSFSLLFWPLILAYVWFPGADFDLV